MSLFFENFKTEDEYDLLTVYIIHKHSYESFEKISGTRTTFEIVLPKGDIYIVFQSDVSSTDKGFLGNVIVSNSIGKYLLKLSLSIYRPVTHYS